MTTPTVSNAYDLLPYPPYSFPVTHVGRLGAIGRIFGLPSVEPTSARVLELGCGLGVNSMAMAQLYPHAEFVAIDYSAKQIETATAAAESAGLKNVRFLNADFSNLEEDLGKFDFIIVHGIYSWVSAQVREAILRIASQSLKPEGIAYVSYNCLPGWRMRGALRDMMLMHTSGLTDVREKVMQSKALLKFLSESCPEETAYGKYLRQELELIRNCDDSYIAHDFLENENEAFYFTDFLKEAAKHGLTYLSDADPTTMMADNLPQQAAQTLKSLNLNLIATEQYIDFVRNRTFRSSLLCHENSTLTRSLNPESLEQLSLVSLIRLKQPLEKDKPAVFLGVGGVELSVSEPLTAEVLTLIAALGREIRPAKQFLDDAVPLLIKKLTPNNTEALRADIGRVILQGYLKKVVDLTLGPVCTRVPASSNPEALPLARWQAANGQRVSGLRLDMHQADTFVAKLIILLDGTRDKAALVDSLVASHNAKEYQLNENNQPITDPARAKLVIEALMDGAIQNLRNLALLLPEAA